MLVYRDGGRRVNSRRELARLRRAAEEIPRSRDGALSLLIQVGEFESAIVDAVSPERDGINQTTTMARAITEDAATEWLALVEGTAERRGKSPVVRRLTQFEAMRLPIAIEQRVSEGYAFYGLFPESYAASARRFAAATGVQRVHVIGIRNIGTSLSSVVATALRRSGTTASTCVVRPHGHPFDRLLQIDGTLAELWRREAGLGAWFAIVDEGPGLSGSSFAAVATSLRSLDIPPSRVALFPAWDPDPAALRSESARRIWMEHPRYCAEVESSLAPATVFGVSEPIIDFSAGKWRSQIPVPAAVQPQHERWKIFIPGAQRIVRFAGLGPYGDGIAARASALSNLGLIAPPGELRSGFLDLPFVPGTPLATCESTENAAAIGGYIAEVAAAFPTGTVADTATLIRMIETNLAGLVPPLQLDVPADIPAAALDARMLAHEWIRTDRGLAKVDALDHHADHFFPGPQSPAWDLAGASIELRMTESQALALLEAYEQRSNDRLARELLPFYRLAYAAFRFGYATLAAETLAGTEDGARFAREAPFYSQWALKEAARFTASSKSPVKQTARSSIKT